MENEWTKGVGTLFITHAILIKNVVVSNFSNIGL